jgi:hypothetical protein
MTRHANAYSRFIEDPGQGSSVLDWLRRQELASEESSFDWGVAFYFSSLGPLQKKTDGSIDAKRSPIVTVNLPRVRRQILWTVGEVHFLSMPLSQFPALESMRRSFLRWFEEFPLIYDHSPTGQHEFDYYLEGSAMNWGPIRAFPSGMIGLQSERYFVSCRETDGSPSTLCKKLRLRGVDCSAHD